MRWLVAQIALGLSCVLVCDCFVADARGSGVGRGTGSRPNFIFVLTDDQRFDALGCMGNSIVRTPHIDRLAAEGTLFTNMFCTTSICAVSRASFITGQYERRHGIRGFRTPLSKQQFAETFPALLRKQGYRTGMVGKWGLGGPLPHSQYDFFTGYSGQGRYFPKDDSGLPREHLTHRLGSDVLEFLEGCTSEKPFLVQLYTKAPHCQDKASRQFQPDTRYNELFRDVEIPRPKTATDRHFRMLPDFLQSSEARKRWKVRFATDAIYQSSVKDYYRLVAGIDDVAGAIVAKLREKGLAENTIIVITSDNGFYLGEHGLAGKWFMHEESIRLPLVIYDPRLPKRGRGKKVSEIALSIDIAPTILDLAGIDIPARIQGRSLVPLLRGENTDWRNDFFYEHRFAHPRIPKSEGVRSNRWKYIRYTSVEPIHEELYDLETDPYEVHNLTGEQEFKIKLTGLRLRWKQLSEQTE